MSVSDTVAGLFFQPFFATNVDTGIRDFANGVRDGSAKNPVDLILFHLGEFDDESGVITPIHPLRVSSGVAILNGDK